MKRTSMRRGKPPARRTRLRRLTRLNPRNRKRAAKMLARNYGERAHAIRAMACLVAGRAGHVCSSRVVAAHTRARGMGGCKGDRRELAPLCDRAHIEAGEHRTSQRADFESKYDIDLCARADLLALQLDAQGFE